MFWDDVPEESWVTPSPVKAKTPKDVPPKPQKPRTSKLQLDLQPSAAQGKPQKTKTPAASKGKLQNASLKKGSATTSVHKKPAGKSDAVGKVTPSKSNV